MKQRDICTTQEEQANDQSDTFEWSHTWQHVLIFFSYLSSYSGTGCFLLDNPEGSFTNVTLQVLVSCFLFGNPLLYLQTNIGQFTRRSCLFLGEMFPFLTGLGYSMILLSFFELILEVFYTAMLLYYLLVNTLNFHPPWMECFNTFYVNFPGCISRRDIDLCPSAANSTEPCFQPGRILSAFLFKEVIAFERTDIKFEEHSEWFVSKPGLRWIFHLLNLFIVYVFLMFPGTISTKIFYMSLRVWDTLVFVIMALTTVLVTTQQGANYGLILLCKQIFDKNFFTLASWKIGFRKTIEILKLAEGGHILFGGFISKSNPDSIRSVKLIIAFSIKISCIAIYFHLFAGLLLYKLNMSIADLMEETEENVIFVLCPTILGVLPSAYFFCFIFFLLFSGISLFSMIIKIMVIETSISQHFKIHDYHTYIRLFICSSLILLACSLARIEVLEEYYNLRLLSKVCGLIIVALQLVVLCLYGIDRISDDIQYMMNVQVSNYIKFIWLITPVLCFVASYDLLKSINFSSSPWVKMLFISFLTMPFLISLIVKIFAFSKQKNFIGIVRPTDLYGPPDPEERIMRVLYNPSLIVKYRRRVEICDHDCLLNTNASKTAIEEEIRLIDHFLRDMEQEGMDKYLDKKFIVEVKKQKKYLLRIIDKDNTENPQERTETTEKTEKAPITT